MAILGRHLLHLATFSLLFLASLPSLADPARFDLTGPKVEVRVTRSGKTLNIDSVPNLQPGDKIWIHPDLPPTQSAKYLLIVAFLRGTTNPPPDDWFTRAETWNKKVREEGIFVTVPAEAQQAIIFLAPETGGDFSTLRSAVKGRPGIFVRASQDLAEAGFEQGRIERYLALMKQVPPSDPKALSEHSTLLARTLNLKPNPDCFKQAVDMQYTCLTQTGNQTLLDDGHGQTLAATIANGPGSDLINQASYTQAFGAGVYSAYVGAIVDLVRLTSTLHTAQYQYIPAIAFPEAADLKLRLNTPPSFHNPKSVIVIGLPAIQAAVLPPLRPADPKFVTCLLKPSVVLPVEGAPLVFSTAFAHDLVLHIQGADPKADLSLTPDAFQGGLIIAHDPARHALPDAAANPTASATPPAPAPTAVNPPPVPVIPPGSNEIIGTVSGFWGFDPFTGPTLRLQNTPGKDWKITTTDNLIIGRENHLDLSSTGTACINTITLDGTSGKDAEVKWKDADKSEHVEATLALKSTDPGALHLSVKQYGDPTPATVSTESFTEPAKLTDLQIHAGDTSATLTGVSLNQVKALTLDKLTFTPAPDAPSPESASDSGTTALQLQLPAGSPAPKLKPGDKLTASITLKDGRTLTLPVTIAPSRPTVTLLNKNIAAAPKSPIQLVNRDDLPVDQQITFSLKSAANFPRTGQIEIANADESLHSTLSVASGTLVLQNPHTLLATLDPLKTFGTSAFGPLRLRPVSPDGVDGDWLPLATLVRLPALTTLHCFADPGKPCTLAGNNLFLLDSISTDVAFTNPTDVPEGFVGTSIPMPHPVGGTFYIRLRDDPDGVNLVKLPITSEKITPPPAPADPAAATPSTTAPAAPPSEE
ncbi:hypothetical protein [Granulicella arctica]|uniref:Uncharacterized protein n=1 Tax=Granulicella arctica TaxID=940613 RepID=A0A7Y9PID4_9BACT|nr:hypothetical protein [Granulicella arctica]NYF80310.1 hypothetical protein [Granulicella arctica]